MVCPHQKKRVFIQATHKCPDLVSVTSRVCTGVIRVIMHDTQCVTENRLVQVREPYLG